MKKYAVLHEPGDIVTLAGTRFVVLDVERRGSLPDSLFLLLFNIPNVLVRYFGCHWGYNSGMKALNRFEELGLTEKIFTAAAIIGLLVIGGMSASMVSINPVVAIGSGDNAIKLIDVINGIMPKMLSLLTTLGVYRLLKKGMKPNTILLGIIVVSVLLTAIGIF